MASQNNIGPKVVSINEIDPKAIVQIVDMPNDCFKFITPCAICISGPQQSGKSTFIRNLVQHRSLLFTQNFEKCYYCQPPRLFLRPNPVFEDIRKVFPSAELICGLPDLNKLNLNLDSTSKLLIIDDLMNDLLNSSEFVNLLSVDTHHSNITVIFTLHNYFASSRYGKTVSRNVNYSVFFYNRLDLRELKFISSQIGNNPNFLQECFAFLMQKFDKERAYILLDGHLDSKLRALHVRSRIFPINNEIKPIVFIPE